MDFWIQLEQERLDRESLEYDKLVSKNPPEEVVEQVVNIQYVDNLA